LTLGVKWSQVQILSARPKKFEVKAVLESSGIAFFTSDKRGEFIRQMCAISSPRDFEQDLAATKLMRHRVLYPVQGVHARHRDREGAGGY
jgi:hypothetical protein